MTDNPKNTVNNGKVLSKPSSKPKSPKPKRDWSASGELPYEKIPAFKAAYDCYKECLQRFRNVPGDSKVVAREIRQRLMRVMVCIAHARLNIKVIESLQEATDLAIEVQVTIRVLVETHAISIKDFAIISQYSQSLVRQMVGWSSKEEQKEKASVPQATASEKATDAPVSPKPPSPPIQGTLF